jgi:hypothetical protein
MLALAVLCAGTFAAADVVPVAPLPSSTARHLLSGVRAFKQGRYEEALVELRVVARAPDAPADLAFYLGPTLYKLGRHREALVVFVTSRAPADALTRFYLGETYYQLALYRNARAVFVALRSSGIGPALDAAASRYVASIDAVYARPPEPATIDVYLEQGLALGAGEPALASEYLEEARRAEALATAPHRHDEITGALGAAGNAAGRTQAVVDALASDGHLATEATWQLARAYVALGDAGRARVLLDGLIRAGAGRADDAVALRAKLAP